MEKGDSVAGRRIIDMVDHHGSHVGYRRKGGRRCLTERKYVPGYNGSFHVST